MVVTSPLVEALGMEQVVASNKAPDFGVWLEFIKADAAGGI